MLKVLKCKLVAYYFDGHLSVHFQFPKIVENPAKTLIHTEREREIKDERKICYVRSYR